MHPKRRAVIDVGTNSVKLLVADVDGDEVQPVIEQSRQTRLGQGFYRSHRLQDAPIASTAKAVADFAAAARDHDCPAIRIIATSAARDAINGAQLTSAICRASGLEVEIISGDQEADWVFQGVATDARLAGSLLLLLDVGGGSTEFIVGKDHQKFFRKSFQVGTVRLLEQMPPGDPPLAEELATCRGWLADFMRREVVPALADISPKSKVQSPKSKVHSPQSQERGAMLLVGAGGTASILGCMEAGLERFDRERLDATRVGLDRMRWHVERLWGLPLEERKKVVGLPSNRADVILMGAVIYEAVMQECGFEEMRISTRGLRFAAVLDWKTAGQHLSYENDRAEIERR